MEFDEFSVEELKLIDERMTGHERSPEDAVPLEQMIGELRAQGGFEA